MVKNQSVFVKDLANKQMNIEREFNAPVEKVWASWTDPKLLDLWWAPKPWKAKTKSQEFEPGGRWLYCMEGPAGEKHWAFAEYTKINAKTGYEATDGFCDENGVKNTSFPGSGWNVSFSPTANGTKVSVQITFKEIAEMETMLQMGFKEGFTMAHGNLDELLANG